MRAGNLDRTITIERATTIVDDYGAPQETWATVASVRAQLIQSSANEFIEAFGAASKPTAIFRIRWLGGVTLADRVTYEGVVYQIVETKELGRRKALELRCLARA
jgi:SPP1 family predicted phage head-tail adaptor